MSQSAKRTNEGSPDLSVGSNADTTSQSVKRTAATVLNVRRAFIKEIMKL